MRIGTDRNSTTIVETLVDLAHNMRMDVVAEGVENFEQVMHLRELGVRLGARLRFCAAAAGQLLPATGRGDRAAAAADDRYLRACGRRAPARRVRLSARRPV